VYSVCQNRRLTVTPFISTFFIWRNTKIYFNIHDTQNHTSLASYMCIFVYEILSQTTELMSLNSYWQYGCVDKCHITRPPTSRFL
jgi:uncharacterized membrane protein